jgi:hypothetical protein
MMAVWERETEESERQRGGRETETERDKVNREL